LFIPHSTRFLFFHIIADNQFDIAVVPTKFIGHELYLDSSVELELGYISLQTTKSIGGILHHLSLMFFNQKFYFYDDMVNGNVVQCNEPNELIKTKQLRPTALLYFRL